MSGILRTNEYNVPSNAIANSIFAKIITLSNKIGLRQPYN